MNNLISTKPIYLRIFLIAIINILTFKNITVKILIYTKINITSYKLNFFNFINCNNHFSGTAVINIKSFKSDSSKKVPVEKSENSLNADIILYPS